MPEQLRAALADGFCIAAALVTISIIVIMGKKAWEAMRQP